jgi:hypothetical protein
MTAADFAEPGPFFRIGREPVGVDILTAIPGVEFDAAWPRRVEDVFDQETNLRATFISREDLLAAKRASGRRARPRRRRGHRKGGRESTAETRRDKAASDETGRA